MNFRLINWNIGGAKFFELPNQEDWSNDESPDKEKKPDMFRAEFKIKLQKAIKELIRHTYKNPHVVTLQEVIQFHEEGDSQNPKNIFDDGFFENLGYRFHFFRLIDTQKFSAQAKWHKIIKKGYWKKMRISPKGMQYW